METVAVISASGKKLMLTNSYRARKLLKKGRAVIHKIVGNQEYNSCLQYNPKTGKERRKICLIH